MRENLVGWTPLSNGYVVSTIERSAEGQAFDSLLSTVTEIVGDIGRADLGIAGDFETMVFPGNDDEISDFGELDFARYVTREEAVQGHTEMITRWQEMPSGLVREVVQDPGE